MTPVIARFDAIQAIHPDMHAGVLEVGGQAQREVGFAAVVAEEDVLALDHGKTPKAHLHSMLAIRVCSVKRVWSTVSLDACTAVRPAALGRTHGQCSPT